MSTRPTNELLYDSEATLRLVDNALGDLRAPFGELAAFGAAAQQANEAESGGPIGLLDLPQVLLRAYAEINSVLANLRRSRDALEQATVEKLQQTNNKLREVSSATEVAATDMLDGLDRALTMVDELDNESSSGDSERGESLRGELRNELFALMNCLQFQDITTQQLNYASSVLVDMEHRLAELARIFDPKTFGIDNPNFQLSQAPAAAFDPAATTSAAEQRQALVDEIFGN